MLIENLREEKTHINCQRTLSSKMYLLWLVSTSNFAVNNLSISCTVSEGKPKYAEIKILIMTFSFTPQSHFYFCWPRTLNQKTLGPYNIWFISYNVSLISKTDGELPHISIRYKIFPTSWRMLWAIRVCRNRLLLRCSGADKENHVFGDTYKKEKCSLNQVQFQTCIKCLIYILNILATSFETYMYLITCISYFG